MWASECAQRAVDLGRNIIHKQGGQRRDVAARSTNRCSLSTWTGGLDSPPERAGHARSPPPGLWSRSRARSGSTAARSEFRAFSSRLWSARRSLVGRHFAAPSALRLRLASPAQAPHGYMPTEACVHSRPSYRTNLGHLSTKSTSNWRRRAVTEVAGTLASQDSVVR